MNFCRQCGSKVASPDDLFCANCGAALKPLEEANADQPTVTAPEGQVADVADAAPDAATAHAAQPDGAVSPGAGSETILPDGNLPPRPTPAPAPSTAGQPVAEPVRPGFGETTPAPPAPGQSVTEPARSGFGGEAAAAPVRPAFETGTSPAASSPAAPAASNAWQPVSPRPEAAAATTGAGERAAAQPVSAGTPRQQEPPQPPKATQSNIPAQEQPSGMPHSSEPRQPAASMPEGEPAPVEKAPLFSEPAAGEASAPASAPAEPAQTMPRQSMGDSEGISASDWSDLESLFDKPSHRTAPSTAQSLFDEPETSPLAQQPAEAAMFGGQPAAVEPQPGEPLPGQDMPLSADVSETDEPLAAAAQPTEQTAAEAMPPAADDRPPRPEKAPAPAKKPATQTTQEVPAQNAAAEKARRIQQAAIQAEESVQKFPGGKPLGAAAEGDMFAGQEKAGQPVQAMPTGQDAAVSHQPSAGQQVYRPAQPSSAGQVYQQGSAGRDNPNAQAAMGAASARDNLPKPRLPEDQPRRRASSYEEPPRRRSSGRGLASRMLTTILVIILSAVILFGGILGGLYYFNRPAAAINDFTEAVSDKDFAKLKKTVSLDGIDANDESWAALCAAFEESSALVQLKAQLSTGGDAVAGTQYPSIELESEEFLLFVKRHHVVLSGVAMVAPGVDASTTLQLGTTSYTGQMSGEGMLYSGIMPGKYDYQLINGEGTATSSGTVQSFDPATPAVLDGSGAAPPAGGDAGGDASTDPAVTAATVTVDNCRSDDAVITVNGAAVPEIPSGGVVTLPEVPVGAEIKITAKQDGKIYEASVVFSDAAATALSFGEYTEVASEAPALGETEINAIIGTFYTSYLDCINNQSTDPLQLATSTAKNTVAGLIGLDGNKANTFSFVSAACDYASAKNGSNNTILVNATFQYSYKARDDAAATNEQGSSQRTLQLINVDGTWLVNNITSVSEGDYSNHVVAAL